MSDKFKLPEGEDRQANPRLFLWLFASCILSMSIAAWLIKPLVMAEVGAEVLDYSPERPHIIVYFEKELKGVHFYGPVSRNECILKTLDLRSDEIKAYCEPLEEKLISSKNITYAPIIGCVCPVYFKAPPFMKWLSEKLFCTCQQNKGVKIP